MRIGWALLLAGWTVLVAVQPVAARESTAVQRLAQQVATLRPDLRDTIAVLAPACAVEGALCLARTLVEHQPHRFRLVPAKHPDTDWIRWAKTEPSVSVRGRVLAINRFGRKVEREVKAALEELGHGAIDIDLRLNRGGDFTRMQDVATHLATTDSSAEEQHPARVWVSPTTASAAEVLAAMLMSAGAVLCGTGPTAGSAVAKAVLIADHDWRLISLLDPIRVPPIDLSDGLVPTAPCPDP